MSEGLVCVFTTFETYVSVDVAIVVVVAAAAAVAVPVMADVFHGSAVYTPEGGGIELLGSLTRESRKKWLRRRSWRMVNNKYFAAKAGTVRLLSSHLRVS